LGELHTDLRRHAGERELDQYARVSGHEIQSLRASERPMDLLILVPSEKPFEYEWVSGADRHKLPVEIAGHHL
jgi:hypothetical protein